MEYIIHGSRIWLGTHDSSRDNTLSVCDICLQNLGNSQREYEKAVVNFSVKNQLRYKGNLGMYMCILYLFMLILCCKISQNFNTHSTLSPVADHNVIKLLNYSNEVEVAWNLF